MNPRSLEEIMTIRKAFEANPGVTDIAQLVDGGALSMQFIDTTMVSIVSSDADYKFLAEIPKRGVDQVLAEYNKNKSHGGGNYRTSFVDQSADPGFADAYVKRLYDQMAYMAEGFKYNRVISKVRNTNDPEIVESTAAMNRMLINLSRALWHGDKSSLSLEFDGFIKKVSSQGSAFVYDCRGALPTAQVIQQKAAEIRTKYFGLVNKFMIPIGTKNLVDSQFVGNGQYVIQNVQAGPEGVMQANGVQGVLSNAADQGKILYDTDLWIDESNFDVPLDWDRSTDALVEKAIGETPPGTPSVSVAVTTSVPNSKWTAGEAGDIKYRVASQGTGGVSAACSPVHDAVHNMAAAGAATLTITHSDTPGYTEALIIYRETSVGSGVYRKIKRIPRTTGATTTFVDLNEDLPGYGVGVLGDFNSRSNSDEKRTFVLSELMKPLKTTFPPGVGGLRLNVGMIEYYSVLQLFAPEKFVVFKNLPTM